MRDLNFKETLLMETYNYSGDYFWENYILSNLVRNLPREIEKFGEEKVFESYSLIFGKESEPLLEHLLDDKNRDYLTEASKIENGLLFESFGEPYLKAYLNEVLLAPSDRDNPILKKWLIEPKDVSKGTFLSSSSIGKFLLKAWEKLKSLGRAVFGPLVPYLKQGFAWAKNLAQQGLAWFDKTPWAKAVLPLLLLVGSIKGIKTLVNKARRRRMNPEEEVALKNYAMKNNIKINEYRQKAGLKPLKI